MSADHEKLKAEHEAVLLANKLLVERNRLLLARIAELEPAAECWDALSKCYRITCMGTAGLPPAAPRENGYAHATFNLWTIKGEPPKGESGDAQDLHWRSTLADFMMVAIRNHPLAKAAT